jgi:hemolysin III
MAPHPATPSQGTDVTDTLPARSHDRSSVGGVREPVNGWIHFAGAVLAVFGLVHLLVEAIPRDSVRHLAGVLAFGASAVLLFSASALYHLRRASPRQRLYQRLDHAMIYLFIAGTYTPICLIALWPSTAGVVALVVIWLLAITGLALDLGGRPLSRGAATAFYLALGWAALPLAPALWARPGLAVWLLIGGVLYSAGALLYWRRYPRRRLAGCGFHELWHLCVLAASASHFWAIRAYVLPL